MLGRIRQSSCAYRPASTRLTSESGCPVAIENWLAPQPNKSPEVGSVGNAAINGARQAAPPSGFFPYPDVFDREEKVNTPLKFAFETLESVIARSRPPNFTKWVP